MANFNNETLTNVCSEDTPVFCLGRTASISIVLGTLSIVTIIGNICVIAAYARDWRIRSPVANVFILNLSICDLIIGAVSFPIDAAAMVLGKWPFGKLPCQIWLVLDYTATNVSVLTILFISLDRYWLLTKKLAYGTFQTHKRTATMVVASWTISLTVYILITFAWGPLAGAEIVDYDIKCELEPHGSIPYIAITFVAEFAIPLSTISYLNVMVYINIRRRAKGICSKVQFSLQKLARSPTEGEKGREGDPQDARLGHTPERHGYEHNTARALQEQTGDRNKDGASRTKIEIQDGAAFNNLGFDEQIGDTDSQIKSVASDVKGNDVKSSKPANEYSQTDRWRAHKVREFRRHRKAAITLSVVVTVFLVLWLPFYVTSVTNALCSDCVSDLAWDVVNILLWCNSTLNPFLYALLVVRFRENMMQLWCRVCRNHRCRSTC